MTEIGQVINRQPALLGTGALAGAVGGFSGSLVSGLIDGLSYVESSQLAGQAVIPGGIGGLVGFGFWKLMKTRRTMTAYILGGALGMACNTTLLSVASVPIRGAEPAFSHGGDPIRALVLGLVGGGFFGGFLYLLGAVKVKDKTVH